MLCFNDFFSGEILHSSIEKRRMPIGFKQMIFVERIAQSFILRKKSEIATFEQ
jgi:hypothetical protein